MLNINIKTFFTNYIFKMAIYILRKQVKNNLEMQFLQKVIESTKVFKEHPELITKPGTKLLSNLKHEFFPKNKTIFNYGMDLLNN